MKRFWFWIGSCLVLCSVAWAQPAADEAPIQYITQYQAGNQSVLVYGLFDIGQKPSVRLVTSALQGGTLKLDLHGMHYLAPIAKPFKLIVTFEDVTGTVFAESAPYTFNNVNQKLTPTWFTGLEHIAGYYGSQHVEIPVPPGTSVINLLGDDSQHAVSPNQLVGYVSHIQIP